MMSSTLTARMKYEAAKRRRLRTGGKDALPTLGPHSTAASVNSAPAKM